MVKENNEGSNWIEITKATVLFKPYSRTRFYYPKAGLLKGLQGFKNCRFKIKRGNKNKLVWNIRLPFFYWERDNNSWKFGNNSIYLWWHTARVR